jgi:hypothetical protein
MPVRHSANHALIESTTPGLPPLGEETIQLAYQIDQFAQKGNQFSSKQANHKGQQRAVAIVASFEISARFGTKTNEGL